MGLAPDAILKPWVAFYVGLGLTNPQIVEYLKRLRRFNTDEYGLRYVVMKGVSMTEIDSLCIYSVITLKRRRQKWNMPATRGAGWHVGNIGPHIEDIRALFPSRGAGDMKMALLRQKGIMVSKYA